MTQPYGQQPGQPGGHPQQGGGYPQQPGYPQAPGYSQGPGGMPAAPPEYSQGPIQRPGTTTAAAVLAFVQAGITLICAGVMAIGLAAISGAVNNAESIGGLDVDDGILAEFWVATIVAFVGVGLLIFGGVKMLGGAVGNIFVIAVGLQILLCLYWAIRTVSVGGTPVLPIILVIMPIIGLIIALGQANKDYVASKSGVR